MSWAKTLTALLAGLLLTAAAGSPAEPPAAAGASCDPTVTGAEVPDVVTYATGAARVTASVTAVDPCSDVAGGAAGVASVEVGPPNSEFFPVARSSGTPQQGTWTTRLRFTREHMTGRLGLHVRLTDVEGNVAETVRSFFVRRNTLITRNASPEPVGKGRGITVRGTLRRLTPTGRYVGYGGRPVDYFFRPTRSGTRVLRGTSTTSRSGAFTKRFRATRDGTWYVRFPGTSNLAAGWSVGDFVDVR